MTIFLKQKGYSLVEMIIYVTLISVVSLLVVRTVLSFTQSYRTLTALRMAEHSGIGAMERMTRDIRTAGSVTTSQSTLNTSPGVLTLVSTSGSVSTTTKFYIQNGTLKVDINGVYSGPLTVASTTVSSLVFKMSTNSVSDAVKVDMTVQATSGPIVKNKTYHSTIILHGQ